MEISIFICLCVVIVFLVIAFIIWSIIDKDKKTEELEFENVKLERRQEHLTDKVTHLEFEIQNLILRTNTYEEILAKKLVEASKTKTVRKRVRKNK